MLNIQLFNRSVPLEIEVLNLVCGHYTYRLLKIAQWIFQNVTTFVLSMTLKIELNVSSYKYNLLTFLYTQIQDGDRY